MFSQKRNIYLECSLRNNTLEKEEAASILTGQEAVEGQEETRLSLGASGEQESDPLCSLYLCSNLWF